MLEHFDLILIINLAHREDRWREILAQFEKIGIPIDGGRVRRFDAVRPDDAGAFPSIGARGCYLSHLGALQIAQASQASSVLIIEDDLDFCKNFPARWSELSPQLHHLSWDFFYGAGEFNSADARSVGGELKEMPSNKPIGTTSFIGLKRQAIASSVAFLEAALQRPAGSPDGGPMHVDGAYCWIRQKTPTLKTLMVTPVLGHQRASRTDIHALKWFDRTPLVRDVVQTLRQLTRNVKQMLS